MADANNKEEGKGHCGGGHRCGGCKFLAGIIVGLLLAGTGFGLYLAGRSHGCRRMSGMCPFMQGMAQAAQKSGK